MKTTLAVLTAAACWITAASAQAGAPCITYRTVYETHY